MWYKSSPLVDMALTNGTLMLSMVGVNAVKLEPITKMLGISKCVTTTLQTPAFKGKTMKPVFEVTTDKYPQVTWGKQYSVEAELPDDMIQLIGISHPVPKSAGEMVDATQKRPNVFVVTRYKLVEEVVAVSNIPGQTEQPVITTISTKVVERYEKLKIEVDNLSEYILTHN